MATRHAGPGTAPPSTAVARPVPAAAGWRVVLPVWLGSLLSAAVLTFLARLGDPPTAGWRAAVHAGGQYDWGFYRAIAEHGYVAAWNQGRAAAFFPLYPAVIRTLDPVLPGSSLGAALIVSALSWLGALLLLHRLVEREFDGAVAVRALWALAAFPTGFFLLAPYPTALFLLLAIGAFTALRGGHWWTAGALCGLASGTRAAGVLLMLPMVYEYVRQHRRIKPDAAALVLAPAGLLAFIAHTWAVKGEPLAFLHAQRFWQRHLQPPWVSIMDGLGALSSHGGQVNALGVGAAALALGALVAALAGPWRSRRDRWAWPVLGVAQLLFLLCYPTSTPDERLMSAARHVLEIFPAFVALAVVARARWLGAGYLLVGLSAQGCLLALYLHGTWIA